MIPDEAEPGSLGPNLDFYGPRTAHGSSLSPAITAALLARAGRSDNALSMLRLALGVDLKDLNGTTAGGLHLATLGGIWQAVLFGFLGVRLSGETLCLDPDLPSAWRTLEARFLCRNRRVRVHVRPGAVDVTTDGPIWVQLAGREAQHVTLER
jgi:trehalose/maltose hydrolase-like predicted phosphorylase